MYMNWKIVNDAIAAKIPVYMVRVNHDKGLGGIIPDAIWKDAIEKTGGKFYAAATEATILQAIRDGIISGTVVQNPWGQAYVGSWVLSALQSGHCTMNPPGQYVDSGSFLVTTDNVDTYDAESFARLSARFPPYAAYLKPIIKDRDTWLYEITYIMFTKF